MKKAETATVKHANRFILKRWNNVREVRRIIALWVLAVGVLIGAAGLQLMWNQRSYQTAAGALGSTYAEAVLGPIDTLNPLFASTNAELALDQLLFSRLLAYDTSGNLNHDIATNVSVNSTGTIYTISLRSDVRWHDGRQLTAKDVVFTAELMKDSSARSEIRGWTDITVAEVNSTTVTFTLPSAYAAFEHALTFPILPEHILAGVEPNAIREHAFSSAPVGSGPFAFRLAQDVDATNDRKIIHLVANESYYRGSPKLARFQVHAYPTRESITQALALREVNAAGGLTQADTQAIQNAQYTVTSQPIQNGVYALLNTESAILSDVAVRRALQRATNTQEIRDKLGDDVPSLDLPFTNGQVAADMPERPAYSLDESTKLLDDAGWTVQGGVRKKDGVELRLSVVTTKDAEYERVLETLIGQWRQLSIVVDEQIIDASDPAQNFTQAVLQQRNFDVLLYQLAIGRDPDVYAYWHSSQATARGLNFSNYSNAVSDDALSSARGNVTSELRDAKYITFARQWLNDAPAIGLYQSSALYVHSYGVRGYDNEATLVSPYHRYSSVLQWTVGSRTVYKTP